MRVVLRLANDPARRFRLLWYLVAWGCAGVFLAVGATYAAGGNRAVQMNHTYDMMLRIEGSLRVHGVVMMALAVLLIYTLKDYRLTTRIALFCELFYSMWVVAMMVGQHFVGTGAWAAPWWYVLTTFLTASLLILAPPLTANGRRYTGVEGSGSV